MASVISNKIKGSASTLSFNEAAFKRFIHWIEERHLVHTRRQQGLPKPWTDDMVLQNYFFTNPYRENDKVTVWFRENLRNKFDDLQWLEDNGFGPDPTYLPWATVAFRWFNYIPTGRALSEAYLFYNWNGAKAKSILHAREKLHFQIFTGAYMIKIENGRSKIDSCCDQITKLWDRRREFYNQLSSCTTLEQGWRIIYRIPFIGPFMAYEVITDLRHTSMFNKAPDIMTWCNLGPGAIRGLWRLTHDDSSPPKMKGAGTLKNSMEFMQKLLALVNETLDDCCPRFEMREVEHSLCEFDKYCRALFRQGTMKRKYNGVS